MRDVRLETPHQGVTLARRRYRADIDGLRAVAVSAVITYHFWDALLPGGFLGVDMFFVISGYVITASLSEHSYDSIQDLFIGFYSRRVKRLLPALLVCVGVTSLLGALFIHPELSAYSASMKAGLFSLFGLSNIYLFTESSDYFGTSAYLNLFTHTWSLGVEEQFYIVFPALYWMTSCASRRPNGQYFFFAVQGFLTVLSFALYIWLNKSYVNGSYFLMPPRFWELSIGCMTALLCPNSPQSGGSKLDLVPWLSFIVVAIALFISADLQLYATPAIVVGTAVLIATLHPGHSLYRLLTLRGMLLVGLMSYSLYLWHWSILAIAHWTIGVHSWTAPFLLPVIAALAAFSYWLVERPLRRTEWSTSKLKAARFGVIATACAAGAILFLQSGVKKVLYTGTPAALVAKGVATLQDNKWYAGNLQWRARDCILSSDHQVGRGVDADRCTLGGTKERFARRFLVIGNSFSAAEFEMYSALSEGEFGSVIATSSWGASPVPELPNTSPWAKANTYYWDSVVPTLTKGLGSDDFVIMINDLSELTPATLNSDTSVRLGLLKAGLQRLIAELGQKGIQVIFQSPNPLMREAQCTPDIAKRQWFNKIDIFSPCQYYSKSQSLQRVRPVYQLLEDLRSVNSNFYILDLFPVMCPGDVCRFYDAQDIFLYRDEWSHPSIEANYLARPVLLSVVNNAIATLSGKKTSNLQ